MGLFTVTGRSTLAGGQPEDVSQVLANLDLLAAILNGNIDNANLAAGILPSKLAGYPADAAKYLRGDGVWGYPVTHDATLTINAANTDIAWSWGAAPFVVESATVTGTAGTVRSLGAGTAALGTRFVLRSAGAVGTIVTIKNGLAGGAGAQILTRTGTDVVLGSGETIELEWQGTFWLEINRNVSTLHGADAYGQTLTNVPTVTYTALNLNTEIMDTDGFHDTVTNNTRMTVPTGMGGLYLAWYDILWGVANVTGYRFANIRKNGVAPPGAALYSGVPGGNGNGGGANSASGVISLAAGDYIEVWTYQDSGVTLVPTEQKLGLMKLMT